MLQGEPARAAPLLSHGLEILENALGAEHPDVGWCLGDLAAAYRALGEYAEAERSFRRALAIVEKSTARADPELLEMIGAYAETLRASGRGEEAQRWQAELRSRRSGEAAPES